MTDTKAKNYDGQFAIIEPTPISFPNLIKPRAFEKKGKKVGDPKYGATAIFAADSEGLKDLKRHVITLAKKKWPGADLKSDIEWPWKKGEAEADRRKARLAKEGKKPDMEYLRGKVTLKGSSKFPVKLGVIDGGRIIDLDSEEKIAASEKKFYAGAKCLLEWNFIPTARDDDDEDLREGQKLKFFVVYLNRVVTTGKGEKIAGGGKSSAEVFKGYKGAVTDEDPIGDDEIDF